MSQFTFDKNNMKMVLEFDVEYEFGENECVEIEVFNFEQLNRKLTYYYTHLYEKLFDRTPMYASLIGLRFEVKESTQKVSIDFGESFQRTTMIFDDNSFTAIKEDKLKRIRKILME